MKLDRQNVIMEIITKQDIETQNQLPVASKVPRPPFPGIFGICV